MQYKIIALIDTFKCDTLKRLKYKYIILTFKIQIYNFLKHILENREIFCLKYRCHTYNTNNKYFRYIFVEELH